MSQYEQALYVTWEISVEENKSPNNLIKKRIERIQVMRYESENLQTKKYSGGKASVHTHRIFYGPRRTSEETEWIIQKKGNTKKKKGYFFHLDITAKLRTTAAAETTKHRQIIIYQARDYEIV